ncbi:alpha/beta hydrolase [Corynebacterium imitans]|uniref:alpha/beta hydrolase n=1 Tax=Corynebacterium imitans TaxID=156978 RepID=UPI00255094B5|nr:alpha/beta hydrolase [Corynebacterium imitans]MDK8307078.1 alpha/beta hydrolase [Corynebacterium imitans]MDK8638367.1 alpha/beta hydrolase [Corynebacterium imitans]MDK8773565.1 alpha/beta hydrolase [Corynebacterium imitans]
MTKHATTTPSEVDWYPDILGDGYKSAYLHQGKDPDTGKSTRATLVRATINADKRDPNKPAIMWVHGMSDYFFQTHVAEAFTAAGYPFYALDLRRCGRSRQNGEYWHYTEDLAHYFPELSDALRVITHEHGHIVPLAHSAGGLITSLWVDHLRRTSPEDHALVQGLILNSPWIDLQFSPLLVKTAKPVLKATGRILPRVALPDRGFGAYGKSIHADHHGEWDFNTKMKPLSGHKKYTGWFRAIVEGQERIHADDVDTGVPVLTLVSSHSYLGEEYSPAADTADTVLDVEQIKHWAPHLAEDTDVEIIDGALHDVFLSGLHARDAAFKACFSWLDTLNSK